MRSKAIGLLAVGLMALPSAGNAALVTISGQGAADGNWNIFTVTPIPGNVLPAGVTGQVWWGNSTLARAFAEALGGGLGYPNNGQDAFGNLTGNTYSPFFAYSSGSGVVGITFEARTMQNGVGSVAYATRFGGHTFAFAERATVTPPPVPLPAAAWLLLSGLAGLGFLGRRRKVA